MLLAFCYVEMKISERQNTRKLHHEILLAHEEGLNEGRDNFRLCLRCSSPKTESDGPFGLLWCGVVFCYH